MFAIAMPALIWVDLAFNISSKKRIRFLTAFAQCKGFFITKNAFLFPFDMLGFILRQVGVCRWV